MYISKEKQKKLDIINNDFNEKEKQYIKTIEELKNQLYSNSNNQIIKNNLKITTIF